MPSLALGDVVEAEVTRVEAYGVYLRFRDADILVLIPDVSYEPISDLKAHFRVGERVRVRILLHVSSKGTYKGTIKAADDVSLL